MVVLVLGGAFDSLASAPKPNILIILCDDLGFSDLGCYGGEARTPNLDRLAANGIRFRNFYNTARCSTSRMSLLTGLYPQQVMTDPKAGTPPARTDNNVFIPELLRNLGYRTYLAGKWHLGDKPDQLPRRRGFQHVFAPTKISAGTISYWDRNAWGLSSQDHEIPARTYGTNAYEFYSTDAIGDYAIDFLSHHFAKKDTNAFFMFVAFNAPHFDIAVDKAITESAPPGQPSYMTLYAQGWDVVRSNRYQRMLTSGIIHPRHSLSPMSDSHNNGKPDIQPVPSWSMLPPERQADLVRRMALYTASIDKVDQNVGRVLARLAAGGQLTNTLICVLSDNGACAEGGRFGWARTGSDKGKIPNHAPLLDTDLAEMGQPFRFDHISIGGGWANVANTPFRFYKQFVHDGGVHTPLIVHWPQGISNPGRWSEQTGHVIDLMPTLLTLAGATYPTQYNGHPVLPMEGRNLAPVFRQQPEFSRTLGFEHMSNRAWLEGNWKLVTKNFASVDGSSAAHALELYDLASDPTELRNLASSQPARVKAMVQAWNIWASHVGVPANRLLTNEAGGPSAQNPAKASSSAQRDKRKAPVE
jgi:arylsulfatase